jgi:hypothetical protein
MEDLLDPQVFWRLDEKKRFEVLLGAVIDLQCEHLVLKTRIEVLEKIESESNPS